MKGGFVTRSGGKRGIAPARVQVNKAAMVKMASKIGERAADSMNPEAKTPGMAPHLPEDAEVYFVGESPSAHADEVGDIKAGAFGRKVLDSCRAQGIVPALDHACRTLAPSGGLEKYQVEAFRESVESSIDSTDCKLIVGCGNLGSQWLLGSSMPTGGSGSEPYEIVRGRFFPVIIKGKVYMATVIQSPERLAYEFANMKYKRPGWRLEESDAIFSRDMEMIAAMVRKLDKSGAPKVPSAEQLKAKVEVLTDTAEILSALEGMKLDNLPIAYDIETTALRPYSESSRISTMAIASDKRCIAFPYRHADSGFGKNSVESIKSAMEDLFISAPVCVAHNAPFELEWMGVEYGIDFLFQMKSDCTLQQAYILDQRGGAMSLNWLSVQYFGLHLKSLTDVNTKYVELNNMHELLVYNGLDALVTLKLWQRQSKRLERNPSLRFAADSQNRRVRTLVVAQIQGMPVDQEQVKRQKFQLEGSVQILEKEIMELPVVRQYSEDHGQFNPLSGVQLTNLFESIGHKEIEVEERGEIKRSVDSDVLSKIAASGGPGAALALSVVELRAISKNAGTYIGPLDKSSEVSIVHEDGLVHPQFKVSRTSTGRLSCADPNIQNYPKRTEDGKRIRTCYAAPEGHSIVSVDYSQLEACVIAMLSEDPVWMGMVSEGYDAHMEWSEIVAKQAPYALKADTGAESWDQATKKQRKEYRGLIKNKLVFPAFFGATQFSISGYLGITESDAATIFEQFWSTFSGVKAWQDRLVDQYKQRRYTECATGRRRYGPLSNKSMVLNSPVQGTASDIVVESMCRISDYAQATGRKWLHPRVNIHDDITFILPNDKLEKAVGYIMREMTKPIGPWCRVPLSVEAEVGPNWAEMETFAAHRGMTWKESQ